MESSNGRRVTIDGLHDEILLMIFMAAIELVDDVRRLCWEAPSLLSHVCRRWRETAIAYPLLWTTLDWTPRQSLHLANTVLQRSRLLPISVKLRMTTDDRPLSTQVVADAHMLVGTVLRDHVYRLTRLAIWVDEPFYDANVFAPLCGQDALHMPLLREFWFRVQGDQFAASDLYISAHNLGFLAVDNFPARSYERLIGVSTTNIHLGGFTLKLSELVRLLQSAPNVVDLTLGSAFATTAIEDDLGLDALHTAGEASTTVGRRIETLTIELLIPSSIGLVNQVLSRDHIANIVILFQQHEFMLHEWMECMSISSLQNVTYLEITGNNSRITLGDAETDKIRSCYFLDMGADDCVPVLLAAHPAILDTIQSLSMDLLDWDVLVEWLWQRGNGVLPVLQKLFITINQDEVHDGIRTLWEVDGSILDFPALELLQIVDRGRAAPTLDLMKYLLHAISPFVHTLNPGGDIVYQVTTGSESLRFYTLPLRCQELEDDDLVEEDIRRVARIVRGLSMSYADMVE
ncbi:hypothetical protein EXIGLDRAFT_253829 [Exidia glandulosa HHB12029]|uniref:Uncharacterized protein n=1 Tax=Exidia glandulosa HHB12029 TaxID=1314781 RepID=A0A165DX90_EXIGL|nr:hypothetical protein EXIGLDRAFT_253829 [Exidia glandulosa HHB12029]